ncbi:MAG: hypothetical protein QXR45_12860 [Candidatus Bathyarchaeia archaeon]
MLVCPLGYPGNHYPAAAQITISLGEIFPVQYSQLSFEDALKNIVFTKTCSTEDLSPQELSQLLWAAYGHTNVTYQNTYHRTTPSAYGVECINICDRTPICLLKWMLEQ